MTLRGAVRAAAVTLACGILALYAAEFAVGRFLLAESGAFPDDMFVSDATRGIALAPGFDREVVRVMPFRVTVNREGYRDREWSETRAPRVLLVGSSAAFGVGLDARDGIAARLGAALGPEAAVLDAGVYSYGPPQILATIERECPRWQPAAIVYVHEYKLARRDFLSNRSPASVVGGTGEAPRRFGLALPALRAYLSNQGWHPRQIVERLRGLDRLTPDYLVAHYAVTKPSPEYCADCAARAAETIRRMRAASTGCGARFLMAVLPGPAEATYGMREPATEAVLAALRRAEGDFPIFDLRAEVPRGTRFHIPGLDYPNAPGAAWIAAHLAGPVRQALKG
jgi:hypothetical protein